MKDVKVLVMLFLAVVLLVVPAGQLQGSLVVIGEWGNNMASATNVDASFDLASDADIFNSTTIPHVSISSWNDSYNDVDWYSFSGIVGGTVDLDIDYGWEEEIEIHLNLDTTLTLFDSAGIPLALNGDSAIDPGSVNYGLEFPNLSNDSFIGTYALPYTGLYYAAVSNFFNSPNIGSFTGDLTRPDSEYGGKTVTGGSGIYSGNGNYNVGDYTLHVSVNPVPEPSSLAILTALGLFAAAIRRQRNAR